MISVCTKPVTQDNSVWTEEGICVFTCFSNTRRSVKHKQVRAIQVHTPSLMHTQLFCEKPKPHGEHGGKYGVMSWARGQECCQYTL